MLIRTQTHCSGRWLVYKYQANSIHTMCWYAAFAGCLNVTKLSCCQSGIEAISPQLFLWQLRGSLVWFFFSPFWQQLLPAIHICHQYNAKSATNVHNLKSTLRITYSCRYIYTSWTGKSSLRLSKSVLCVYRGLRDGYVHTGWLYMWFFLPYISAETCRGYIPLLLWLSAAVSVFLVPAL